FYYELRLSNAEHHLDSIDALVRDSGVQGPPGKIPSHRWIDSTKLQWEMPNGEWGVAVNLQGPPGHGGGVGASGVQGPQGAQGPAGSGSGGSSAASRAYTWFMS